MKHQFPIFRRSEHGDETLCVFSESLAILIRMRATYNGIQIVENKFHIDGAINEYDDDDRGNKGRWHTITKKEFTDTFERVMKKFTDTTALMDKIFDDAEKKNS